MLIIPMSLRKRLFYGVAWALIIPIYTLYKLFCSRREEHLFVAKYDSGKGNIERMLNILYDSAERRIYIENGNDYVRYDAVWALTDPQEDGAAFVGDESYMESEQKQIAFTIYIPQSLYIYREEIYNRAKMYVLAGMEFSVEVEQ